MISICIPIYNFNVSNLVEGLTAQIEQLPQFKIEIILIDDHSEESYISQNKKWESLHKFILLPQNVGRSKIRNLFLEYASQPYLLFLDCDSSVGLNPNFIQNYISEITENTTVICGGRIYPNHPPSAKQTLNWKYGTEIESKNAVQRSSNTYLSFLSNNFLIKKDLFSEIRFNENLIGYGHEDTLFGIDLDKKGIQILQIDNPILNDQIEDNSTYLSKQKQSLANLAWLVQTGEIDKIYGSKIKICQFYFNLKSKRCLPLFVVFYNCIKGIIEANLISKNPNLTFFQMFKLYNFHQNLKDLDKN